MSSSGSSSQARLLRWGIVLFSLAFLVTIETRWYLITQLPFMMDELVDTQLAVQVSRGERMYADLPYERMPLMTFVLASFHDPEHSSFEAAVAGRRVLFVVTIFVFIGTWIGARTLLGPYPALLAPALLATFSHYMQQSIRVRADSLSTAASTIALVLLSMPVLQRWTLFAAGASLGVSFATTQKAAYFVLAFAVALGVRRWVEGERKWRWIRRMAVDGGVATLGFATPLTILAGYMALVGGLGPFLRQTFLWGAQVGLVAKTYSLTWLYVRETLERNPAFWILGVAGAVLLVFRPTVLGIGIDNDGSRRARGAAIGAWTLCLIVLLLQHTAKFPYVFINPAPALAICGALCLKPLLRMVVARRTPGWMRISWTVILLLLLVIQPLYHHVTSFSGDLLWRQKEIMDRVDSMTDPEDAVFDGVGMVTTRRKATPYSLTGRWFEERYQGASYDVIGWIRRREPVALILNYRLRMLAAEEKRFLQEHFVQDWANIYVVGRIVDHPGGESAQLVDLLASTTYAVNGHDLSRVRIDGRPAEQLMELSAGPHEVIVEGPAQQVEFRLARALELDPSPPRPVMSLYPSYSQP